MTASPAPTPAPHDASSHDVLILGGGISGLSLASLLESRAEVLEAAPHLGGLARSFGGEGFTADIGGHILFSKDQEALDLMISMLGDNVDKKKRANVILFDGAMVKYPFENGLYLLPNKQDTLECTEGFVRAWAFRQTEEGKKLPPPKDLGEWCLSLFGPGIANKYLIPYNEKIWKRTCKELSTEWVDRVPMPPLQDVLKSAIGIETEGYTHQLYFHYPKVGGIESLARAFAKKAADRGHSLRTGWRATKVKKTADGFEVSNGTETKRCKRLVSTIPILPFLHTLENVPTEVMKAAEALHYNSLRVVLLGVKGTHDQYTAVYVPNSESIYHRVCYNNAFSSSMAPEGFSSVSVEITCRDGDAITAMSDEALAERVITDLVRDGLVKREDVVYRHVHKEQFAYVVYDHGYSERVRIVRDFLTELGVPIAGRFAEYRYVNMDSVVRRTLDLSKELDAAVSTGARA